MVEYNPPLGSGWGWAWRRGAVTGEQGEQAGRDEVALQGKSGPSQDCSEKYHRRVVVCGSVFLKGKLHGRKGQTPTHMTSSWKGGLVSGSGALRYLSYSWGWNRRLQGCQGSQGLFPSVALYFSCERFCRHVLFCLTNRLSLLILGLWCFTTLSCASMTLGWQGTSSRTDPRWAFT